MRTPVSILRLLLSDPCFLSLSSVSCPLSLSPVPYAFRAIICNAIHFRKGNDS